ncbi:MAG: molybdate transport system permease protein [Francisellaceae bacterium]|jgi:molybdate transport system permease protein
MAWISFWITLKLALITTVLLLFIGICLSLWLSASERWYKSLIASLLNMPLILPPTVLGFYLLILFNPNNFFGGAWVSLTGSGLNFSFSGLVIASIIYSLPFAVRPIQNSFESVQKQAIGSAAMLGASYWDRFFSVLLPLSKKGILTSMVLVFAHTIGEFGVVLMVGGSIAGKTKVVSIEIFEQVEQLQYSQANQMALILMLFAFIVLFLVYLLNRKSNYNVF